MLARGMHELYRFVKEAMMGFCSAGTFDTSTVVMLMFGGGPATGGRAAFCETGAACIPPGGPAGCGAIMPPGVLAGATNCDAAVVVVAGTK